MRNALIAAVVAAIVSAGTTAAAVEDYTTPTFVMKKVTGTHLLYNEAVRAPCRYGDVPIGGGFLSHNHTEITENHAYYHGWMIRRGNHNGTPASATVYVICLKP